MEPEEMPQNKPDDNKPVDAAVLQYQNQELEQQLETQKHELHDLEYKIKELKEKQASYDERLIKANQLWNQLIDDIILFGAQAGSDLSALQNLDHVKFSRAEDIFICRLLETDAIQSSKPDGSIGYVKEALASRVTYTRELMRLLEDALGSQQTKFEDIAQSLSGKPSSEDAATQLRKLDDLIKKEVSHLHEVVDILHLKHKKYADEIQSCIDNHSVDQLEIKRLTGELEESMADRSKRLRELKESIEEIKVLAEKRLLELQDARKDNLILSKQMQDLQNELMEDKYVYASHPFILVNDQLQHWKDEAKRYKLLTDSIQAKRHHIMQRENDLIVKTQSIDAARNKTGSSEAKVEELENQLQKCVIDKNEIEIKMEEAMQDSGRKDVGEEFQVMASALSKEIKMMESHLNKWQTTAEEALSLREKAQSLSSLLDVKTSELKNLGDECARQMGEIKSLKEITEKMQKEKQELEFFLDMLGQQIYDNRELAKIKESERRAQIEAETLRNTLDEHSLELRVKVAYEAEAACHQRLSVAEAEIAELKAQLDASVRDVLELQEDIKVKEREADSCISEIETIGQAYEDMQSQNQRLIKQATGRDEFTIKLVSESSKVKQSNSLLLSEKQRLTKQLQPLIQSLESSKSRIDRREEQMKHHHQKALSSIQEGIHIAMKLESAKCELVGAEKELKMLKSTVVSSLKEHEQTQREIDDIKIKLDKERRRRKKLDEELMELNKTVADLTAETGEAAILKLQEEIKDCKDIYNCGACFERPKEAVIVKCFHFFCKQCVQKHLVKHRRKCPRCRTSFGEKDVQFIKIWVDIN